MIGDWVGRTLCKKVRQTHPALALLPFNCIFSALNYLEFFLGCLGVLDAELSGIIMEINDLRRVACVFDRPEQNRRRFCKRAFRR